MASLAKSCKPARWLAPVLLLMLAADIRCQPPATEYEVKAAYLLNFGKFTKWPASSSAVTADKFSVCVVGDNPFGDLLDATVRGEKIEGKTVVARHNVRLQDVTGCQVLFISRSEERQARKLLQSWSKTSVLTVSDMPGFLDSGGMIQFTLVDKRVRFEVNLDAVEEAGLSLSSELLKVASAVRTKKGAGEP